MSYTKTLANFKLCCPEWSIEKQLGVDGKDGRVFLLKYHHDSEKHAVVKCFKNRKSVKMIKKEFELLEECSTAGIAPKLFSDVSVVEKCSCIVMEYMKYTLLDYTKKYKLNLNMLKKIIELYEKLGKLNIFHNDSNIGRNIMINNGHVYLIDFGMSKRFDKKLIKQFGKNPNYSHLVSLMKYLKDNELKVYLRKVIDFYEQENNIVIDFHYKALNDQQTHLEERLAKLK